MSPATLALWRMDGRGGLHAARHRAALREVRHGVVLNGPPPDAVVLSVTGVQGLDDAAVVEAALKRCDPMVQLWSDWPRGLVAMRSSAPARTLCAAVQGAGYGALVQAGPGGQHDRGSVAGIFGRILLYAVLGGVLGVALGVGFGLANVMLNPDCTRPGSSGGCAIGVGLFGFILGLCGIPIGAVGGLIHGLVRRYG